MNNKLTVTLNTFTSIINGLIESGVSFSAKETSKGEIEITFTGGY